MTNQFKKGDRIAHAEPETPSFKKGDKVTVREGATSIGGHKTDPKEVRTVRTVWGDGRAGLTPVADGAPGNVFEPEDLVPYVETPALLDPAKVKAGDTVTLERDGGRLPDQEVVVVTTTEQGWIILVLKGAVAVSASGPDPWLITAHQPAPEPEPEYENGAVIRTAFSEYHMIAGEFVDIHDGGPLAGDPEVSALVVIDPEEDVDRLSNIIREVDGNHDLGAGALAEAILERLAK